MSAPNTQPQRSPTAGRRQASAERRRLVDAGGRGVALTAELKAAGGELDALEQAAARLRRQAMMALAQRSAAAKRARKAGAG